GDGQVLWPADHEGAPMRLHHVQVSMPRGEEERARRFYRDAVGLTEVDKPEGLAGRGGCWFRGFDGEEGVEEIQTAGEGPSAWPAASAAGSAASTARRRSRRPMSAWRIPPSGPQGAPRPRGRLARGARGDGRADRGRRLRAVMERAHDLPGVSALPCP